MDFRCLFHVHTRHSFDSLLSPSKILAKARELQIGALIVTDHDTLDGAVETKRLSHGSPGLVVVAAEYKSEKGDIIGLFLKEEIRSRDSNLIVQEIHRQGGLVVLPHPFKAHKLDEPLLSSVDLIETHNSRCSPEENWLAAQLAQERKIPGIAGADAHCAAELGAAINEYSVDQPRNEDELRRLLLSAPRRALVAQSSPFFRPYSQMVKAAKTKNPGLFLYQAKRFVLTLARRERPS